MLKMKRFCIITINDHQRQRVYREGTTIFRQYLVTIKKIETVGMATTSLRRLT